MHCAKTLLFFTVAMLAAQLTHADFLYEDDAGDIVRVTTLPCPPEVLRHTPEGSRGYFTLALAKLDGVRMATCAALGRAMGRDNMTILVRENGDVWAIDAALFRPAPGN